MRQSLLLSTTALILFGAADAALADDTPETVVVTATRIPTPESQVASSITVITAADIATKDLDTLPDVLQDTPGLNVVQTGGPGGLTSVFMRGTNSNHVKVLVDGIDVSDPSSSNDQVDFGQYLTSDIAKIEVLRGPQSGLYGSDAIGGVINIITKSGEGPAQFTADVNGGSFDTFNQSAGVSGSDGDFHYAANIGHFYSGATPVTPLQDLAPGEARNDDRDDNVTASTKLGYDVTDNFDLGLVGRYTYSQLHFTGDDDFSPYTYPDPIQSSQDYTQYHLRGTAHLSLFDGVFDQTLGVTYSNLRLSDYTPDDYGGPYTFDYAGYRVKVDWQGDIKLADTETLIVGAEHQQDSITLPIDASTTIDSGYAELQSNPFRDFNDTIAVRYDSNSRFGNAVTYRIAPTYFIEATGTKLEASVGSGFKAPTLSEMFESYPAFYYYANPNLVPEKSTGYDAGFEQYLLDNRLQFGATYFYNHITDLIDTVFIASGVPPCPAIAPFGCEQYGNVGRAHTDGVESFVQVQPIDTVTLRADYTYTDAIDDVAHDTLPRRPRNKLSLDARWQATEKLSLDANVLVLSSWIDSNRDYSIPRLTAPGYTTTNIAVNYDITDMFTVYGRIANLFNEQYQDPYGFMSPGRGFFAGIKAKI